MVTFVVAKQERATTPVSRSIPVAAHLANRSYLMIVPTG